MKKRLYLIPSGGLGNRIRFLETASVILKKHGINSIHVLWIVNEELHAKIEDLFDVNSCFKIHTFYTNNIMEKLFTYGTLNLLQLLPFYYHADRNFNLNECIDKNTFSVIEGSERLSDYDHLEFFKPKPSLLNKPRSVLKYSKNIVGVHIRRTDHHLAISYSTDDMFDQIIYKEILSGNHIYLSTDDLAVKKKFMDKYGDNIVTYNQACLVHNKNTQSCRGDSSKLQREFPQ